MSISTIFPPLTVALPTENRLPVAGRKHSDGAVDERGPGDQAEP